MIPILYESTETAFASNGLGRLRDCISCKVTEERNGIYECDFEYPVNGSNYDRIQLGRIIAVKHDYSDDIQPFDIVSYERPIDGVVTFHAVHISYRQSKMVASGTGINSLTAAFTMLSGATPENPFSYVTDKNSTGYMAAADGVPRSVREMLGGVEGSILDTYGGEYEWDKWTVHLWDQRGREQDLTIRYGLNLLDYTDEMDYSEAYTSCIPYWTGQDANGADVTVKGNKVDSGQYGYNGRDECIALDLSEKFENKPTAAQLQTSAALYMASNRTYLPHQSIDIDFIRIEDSAEYAEYSSLFSCKLCDTIRVVFPRYNMNGKFKIVRTVYDVLLERFEEMELGALSTTLAEALGVGGGSELSSNSGGDWVRRDGDTMSGDLTAPHFITPYNYAFRSYLSDQETQVALMFVSTSDHLVYGNNSYPTDIRGSSISVSTAISELYKVTDVQVTISGGIAANTYLSSASYPIPAASQVSGYNAVGIVGYAVSNWRIKPTTNYVSSNTTIYAGFSNDTSTGVSTDQTVTFKVLWLKATSA